jgi:hypothetical protein
MSDFQILGHGEHGGKSKLPLYLVAGAAVLGLLIFRRQSGTSPPAGDGGLSAEFYRTATAARADMAKLTATNDLQRHQMDLAYENTPAGLTQSFTPDQWKALPSGVRKTIKGQAARGGSTFVAGEDGSFSIIPTYRGFEGNLQAVQRGHSGLLGNSSYGIGAPAPQVARPAIIDIAQAYFKAAADAARYAGGGY